jgi:hypothetical protein
MCKYGECITLLNQIPCNNLSPKIFYERQALLFKATHLEEPDNLAKLVNVIKVYEKLSGSVYKNASLTQEHHTALTEMLEVVKKGRKKSESNSIDRERLKDILLSDRNRGKRIGLPSYIVSKNWMTKLNKYLLGEGGLPGPITNFDILNHIFEFKP